MPSSNYVLSDARRGLTASPRRALTPQAGGCCCSVCASNCASSPAYNCDHCTGAATASCASCYWIALDQNDRHGACYSPPPVPPVVPPSPLAPPLTPMPVQPPSSPPVALLPTRPPLGPLTDPLGPELVEEIPGPGSTLLVPAAGMLVCILMFLVVLRFLMFCHLQHFRRQRLADRAMVHALPRAPMAALNLDHLPTRRIPPQDTSESPEGKSEEVQECAICLGQYVEGEDVMQLPCKHEFHCKCIRSWLEHNAAPSCPLCKRPVVPQRVSTA